MAFFDASHGRIAYDDTAAGQENIIFMHGLPTAKEQSAPLQPYLRPSYRLVAFDLHDYGQSEKVGRHAPYIPPAHTLRLRQDISASNLAIIEDGTHFLPIDTPQQVVQEINGFIDSS